MDGAFQRSRGAAARHPVAGAALTAARRARRAAAGTRTWIGLLRGINVGGRNKVPMKELAALLAGLGFDGVRTYIQSGNIVFRSAGTAAALSARIGAAMAARFGFRPHLVLLEVRELERVAAANPFSEGDTQPQLMHVWFLERFPPPGAVRSLEALRAAGERLAVRGAVLYLHAPDGIGHSKLAARAESVLGVAATARNWRTVTQLLAMAGEAR